MKFNFWQVLGLILIIVGVVFFFRSKTGKNDERKPTTNIPAAATAPATAPAPTAP